MNKTISINIGGYIFHIEEDAYEKLKKYLDTIRGYFRDTVGRDEIIGDIEARIAEMFNERVKDTQQAILIKDVDEVVAVMGQPEAFIDVDAEESSNFGNSTSSDRNYDGRTKRLFRDPDSNVLGGVCSGIAHYFAIEAVWLRLAFIGSVLFFGSGFLLYFILWLIIPEAKTTAEKLEMKGESVNIENIERTIKEEIDSLKTKFHDLSDEAKAWSNSNHSRKARNLFQRTFDFLIEILKSIFRFGGKILGIILVVLGTIMLVSFLGSVAGLPTALNIGGDNINFLFLSGDQLDFLGSSQQISFGLVGLLLLVGIPILQVIYGDNRITFAENYT